MSRPRNFNHGNAMTGRAWRRVPKLTRTAPGKPNSIPCPNCKAEAGTPCVSLRAGTPIHGVHTERQRMYIRAENLRREQEA